MDDKKSKSRFYEVKRGHFEEKLHDLVRQKGRLDRQQCSLILQQEKLEIQRLWLASIQAELRAVPAGRAKSSAG